MSKPPPGRYRTIQDLSYNASRQKCGALLIWLEQETVWLAPSEGGLDRRGAPLEIGH